MTRDPSPAVPAAPRSPLGTAVPATRRALGPDLARGGMLALIAVANLPTMLWGETTGADPWALFVQHGDTEADRLALVLRVALVDMRAVPLFTLLFGYGMVQFARSRAARGVPPRRVGRMLRRRHVAMVAIGALHAALLFSGDVLGAYGLLGLVTVPLVFSRSAPTLRVLRTVLLGISVVFSLVLAGFSVWAADADGPSGDAPGLEPSVQDPSWAGTVLPRLVEWTVGSVAVFALLPLLAALLTGWIWARDGVLDRPQEHRRLLRRTAVGGLAIAWAGGAVTACAVTGVLVDPGASWGFVVWHSTTGFAGGVGYAALFALVAARAEEASADGRPTGPVRVVAAVGKRSLSAYLWQSLCLVPLAAAWGLGWGGRLGTAGAVGVALVVWGLSVLWCSVLERAGRRGPAEVVLRRLTYGRG